MGGTRYQCPMVGASMAYPIRTTSAPIFYGDRDRDRNGMGTGTTVVVSTLAATFATTDACSDARSDAAGETFSPGPYATGAY